MSAAPVTTAAHPGTWLAAALEPMEEEDRSDTDDEDSLASRTVAQNLELLTTTLQTYLRDEIGIVRGDVVKQSGVVESLVSAVRETQLEMRGLKALIETMSEGTDRLTE